MKQNRLSLNDVEWREFRIKDIFNISLSKGDNKADLLMEGNIPLISSGSTLNGITKFINQGDGVSELINSNTITVDMFGQSFFQPYNYFSVSHGRINILTPLKEISKESMKFITCCINDSTKDIFSYNRMCSSTRLNKLKILLPIGNNKDPNWQFMEEYIKQEQKDIAQKVINYYEQKMLETSFDLVGLGDVEWRKYSLEEIFRIESVKGKTISTYKEGCLPYVSTSSQNNGVSGFVDSDKNISSCQCISVDPIAGNCFYHEYEFVGRGGAGSAINLLYNDHLNKKNAPFILSSLEKVSKEKASYGIALNGQRLKSTKIILPSDENGNPHWDYMSQFMQKLEAENLEKVLEYIYIYKLAISYESTLPLLHEKEWKEFWLEDIVTVKSGARLTKASQIEGDIPFIGSTDNNNGMTSFISNKNSSLDSNVLGVNYNGSVVENFYHPYQAVFSDDVKRVHWKDKKQENEYTYLFLKQIILQQKKKYAYGYKFNASRMRRQKIILPIDNTGELDFEYMRRYVQIEKIKQCHAIIEHFQETI